MVLETIRILNYYFYLVLESRMNFNLFPLGEIKIDIYFTDDLQGHIPSNSVKYPHSLCHYQFKH